MQPIVEASYRTLLYYFPEQAATLPSAYHDALALSQTDGATSAVAEVLSHYLHTDAINVRITSSTVATMPFRDFATAGDLRAEIVEARLWGGIHYRGSTLAGVKLGRKVARWDLRHAFHGHGM